MLPTITSHDQWMTARKKLLGREQELTRARDLVSQARRELPMVPITKDYALEGPNGTRSLWTCSRDAGS